MVKNKALPDSARTCCTPCLVTLSLSLSLFLSLSLPRRLGPIKAGLTSLSRQHRSSWGYPLDPAKAGPWQFLLSLSYFFSQPSKKHLLSTNHVPGIVLLVETYKCSRQTHYFHEAHILLTCIRVILILHQSQFSRESRSTGDRGHVDVCMLRSFIHVWLFVTPWAIAHQPPLPIILSQ